MITSLFIDNSLIFRQIFLDMNSAMLIFAQFDVLSC